jgi:mannose-6-phosphate isomerase-like protein (cupin superfamily)
MEPAARASEPGQKPTLSGEDQGCPGRVESSCVQDFLGARSERFELPTVGCVEATTTHGDGEGDRSERPDPGRRGGRAHRNAAARSIAAVIVPGMNDKINLADKLELLDGLWQPGIVGYLNDYKLVVVKVQGEFVWHKHDETDDFFLVLAGTLTIQLRDRDVVLRAGEMFVVPRGVKHCPKADQEAHVLLIEPRGTANTGDAGGDLTAPEVEI